MTVMANREIRPLPQFPSYGIDDELNCYSLKRRGRPSARFVDEPEWQPVRTQSTPGKRRSTDYLVVWDSAAKRTIRVRIKEAARELFPEVGS